MIFPKKKEKILLTTYKNKPEIWTHNKGYPQLKCMHRENENCSNECVFFYMKRWKTNTPMYCDKDKLGVLA
jgi:hypothetical protein